MLSERLKALRKKDGATQEEFAERLGIARSTYSGYERGTSEPDNETLDKIAKYFSVTTDYLLGRSENNIADLDAFKLNMLDDFNKLSKEDQQYIMGLIKRLPKD